LQVECYVTHGDDTLSLFLFKTKGCSGDYDPLYNFHVYNGNLLFEERRVLERGLLISFSLIVHVFVWFDVYIIKS